MREAASTKCCQENKFKKGKIYVTIKKNKELEEKNLIMSNQIDSTVESEHSEVKFMRDFMIKQVRSEFLKSKENTNKIKLLSSLDEMFNDPYVVGLFTKFCQNKLCMEYINYIEDMAAYYNMKEDLKPLLFFDFRDKYFREGAPYFLNIKVNVIREVCDAKTPRPDLLDKALSLVNAVFRVELIREFKYSSQFNEYLINPKGRKKKSSKKLSKLDKN